MIHEIQQIGTDELFTKASRIEEADHYRSRQVAQLLDALDRKGAVFQADQKHERSHQMDLSELLGESNE